MIEQDINTLSVSDEIYQTSITSTTSLGTFQGLQSPVQEVVGYN